MKRIPLDDERDAIVSDEDYALTMQHTGVRALHWLTYLLAAPAENRAKVLALAPEIYQPVTNSERLERLNERIDRVRERRKQLEGR